jgi:hypothetical protein
MAETTVRSFAQKVLLNIGFSQDLKAQNAVKIAFHRLKT